MAAIVTMMVYTPNRPIDGTDLSALVGWHTVVLGSAVLLMALSAWGTWLIDLEGVRFEPCHGAARRLSWSRVERVQWDSPGAKLRGDGVKISIPWHLLPSAQARAARERVEK